MKVTNISSKMHRWVHTRSNNTQLSAEVNAFTPAEGLIHEYQSWRSSQMMSMKAKEMLCQPNLWKPQWQLRKNWWDMMKEVYTSPQQSPGPEYAPASRQLWAWRSKGVGILYRHPPYWLINNTLRMYKGASSKARLWFFHLFLNLSVCRACADSPVLLLQPTHNSKKNPIAMFHDDFNALLLGWLSKAELDTFFRKSCSLICHPNCS